MWTPSLESMAIELYFPTLCHDASTEVVTQDSGLISRILEIIIGIIIVGNVLEAIGINGNGRIFSNIANGIENADGIAPPELVGVAVGDIAVLLVKTNQSGL